MRGFKKTSPTCETMFLILKGVGTFNIDSELTKTNIRMKSNMLMQKYEYDLRVSIKLPNT